MDFLSAFALFLRRQVILEYFAEAKDLHFVGFVEERFMESLRGLHEHDAAAQRTLEQCQQHSQLGTVFGIRSRVRAAHTESYMNERL